MGDGHGRCWPARRKNVVIVALANKLARIVWAVLAHDRADDVAYATA